MNIDEVIPLESVKGKLANSITVFMDLNFKNPDFFAQLKTLEDKSRPGEFFMELIDLETRQTLKVHSKHKIPINRQLVNLLEECELNFNISNQSEKH